MVPLLVSEAASALVDAALREDGDMIVWWGAEVECVSGLSKALREGRLPDSGVDAALERLGDLMSAWSEVRPTDELRVRAERLLFAHPLKAADAMQLGAALLWAADSPARAEFVSLDRQLRTAARKEGFDVLPAKMRPGSAA